MSSRPAGSKMSAPADAGIAGMNGICGAGRAAEPLSVVTAPMLLGLIAPFTTFHALEQLAQPPAVQPSKNAFVGLGDDDVLGRLVALGPGPVTPVPGCGADHDSRHRSRPLPAGHAVRLTHMVG